MPELTHPYPIPEAGIKDDAVTSAKIKDAEIVNADIAVAAAIAYVKLALTDAIVNADIAAAAALAYSKLATDPRICRIKTGTYTGDGAATQTITGVGFEPKAVLIVKHVANYAYLYLKNDQMGLYAFYNSGNWAYPTYVIDVIISLDSDGFTIGDGLSINNNGEVHSFICWG